MTYFFANKSILNRTFETLAPPHLRDTGYLQGKKKLKLVNSTATRAKWQSE